jgi:valacyclovir hydrolase
VGDRTPPYLHFGFSGIRDVSKWSEKARKPLEALYGYDYLAKTCEDWVDGISQFKQLPEGMLHGLMVPLLIAGQA